MIKMLSRKNTKNLPDFSCTHGRMWKIRSTPQNVSLCCSQCMLCRGIVLMRITHHSVVWFPGKSITACQTSKQALLLAPCYTTWLKSNSFPLSQQLMHWISMSNKDQWIHQRPRILPHKIKNILILWVNFSPQHETLRKLFYCYTPSLW